MGYRITYSEDSYRKIGTSETLINIIRNGSIHSGNIKLHGKRLLLVILKSSLRHPMFSSLKSADSSIKEPLRK